MVSEMENACSNFYTAISTLSKLPSSFLTQNERELELGQILPAAGSDESVHEDILKSSILTGTKKTFSSSSHRLNTEEQGNPDNIPVESEDITDTAMDILDQEKLAQSADIPFALDQQPKITRSSESRPLEGTKFIKNYFDKFCFFSFTELYLFYQLISNISSISIFFKFPILFVGNPHALKVLKSVREKLEGYVESNPNTKKEIKSVKDQVQFIIEQATNTGNLARMYEGWMSWI